MLPQRERTLTEIRDSLTTIIDSLTTNPAARPYTGCPCGCTTKPGIYDDPDCIRHRRPATRRQPC